jgi:hypothetical protein
MGSLDSVQELGTVKNFGVYLLRPRILSNSITKVVDLPVSESCAWSSFETR